LSLIKKISDRLKQCDRIQEENLKLAESLSSESERKADYLSEEIIKTEKKLSKKPHDKNLQREYAGQVMARQMFIAGKNLNDSLIEFHEEKK